jgi:stage II sporulation protein D
MLRGALIVALAALAVQAVSCRLAPGPSERELALYPEEIGDAPGIRVLVQNDLKQATISVSGPYEIRAVPEDMENPVLGGGNGPLTTSVYPTKTGFILGDADDPRAQAHYRSLKLVPLEGTRITVDGTDYGGEVILHSRGTDEPRLRVVARVDIERYLTGVVPHEMYSNWPEAALRAQAVASRTYALYKIKTRSRLDYDVHDTTASQVWKPDQKVAPHIRMVVNSTRGVVMSDNWRLFPSYYSMRCGGETKDGADVFVSRHIAPLTGVRCPYCGQGPEAAGSWTFRLAPQELAELLREAGYAVGRVTRVQALDRHARPRESLGRVYDVAIHHQGPGRILTLPALRFRGALGGGKTRLASTYFEVENGRDAITFRGRGNGHGVGMCQWGAHHLAENGHGYRSILDYYYRGHTLVKLW